MKSMMLPNELYSRIFDYLKLTDWSSLCNVSEGFYSLILHLNFKYQVILKDSFSVNQKTQKKNSVLNRLTNVYLPFDFRLLKRRLLFILSLPYLEVLTITNNDKVSYNFDSLIKSSRLKEIICTNKYLFSGELKCLKELSVLEKLRIRGYDGDLIDIFELSNLKSFHTSHHFTTHLFNGISQLYNLETLSLESCYISDEEMIEITELKRLKTLEFNSVHLATGHELNHLKKLSNLESLGLQSTYGNLINIFDQIREMKLLRSLNIGYLELVQEQLVQLKELNNLEILKLSYGTDQTLNILVKFERLKELEIFRCRDISEEELENIRRMKSLKKIKLIFNNGYVSCSRMEELKTKLKTNGPKYVYTGRF